ncbi:MAG: GTP pyrophosphokinase family protein [Clostridiales bacterium]|nr:GTP pyrophosphokinase family protein [Clostridiales bacterium]
MDTNLSDNGNLNPNSELHLSTVNVPNLAQVPDDFVRQAKEFQRALMMYSCAIREVKTKLEVLNDDLSIRNQRNPIELIKSRVKKPSSIVEKLRRKGYPVTVESMMEHLDDVAGIRVICSFLDEIYTVADMLVRQDDVKVLTVKDYIRNPKPNGYRSYHLILEIPVYFSDEKKNMRVEVQIRTIAMDFWASLDHQLKYKKDIVQDSQLITEELRQCAEVIANTDQQMLRIRQNIEQQGGIVMVD